MDAKSTIYSKKGDFGSTTLASGEAVNKSSLRIIVGGELDELNAFLGLTRTYIQTSKQSEKFITQIIRIQNELAAINATIACAHKSKIEPESVTQLEQEIDAMQLNLPPLNHFIIPGTEQNSAWLHVCRTVCRRAERAVVNLQQQEKINPTILAYLNRLSDWLFVSARFMENQ